MFHNNIQNNIVNRKQMYTGSIHPLVIPAQAGI